MGQDPVEALKGYGPAMGPLVEVFSFMAILTSFVGYILGLAEYFQDVLPSEGQVARAPAYAITLAPPYVLALAFPDVFFAALDKVRGPQAARCCLSGAGCGVARFSVRCLCFSLRTWHCEIGKKPGK